MIRPLWRLGCGLLARCISIAISADRVVAACSASVCLGLRQARLSARGFVSRGEPGGLEARGERGQVEDAVLELAHERERVDAHDVQPRCLGPWPSPQTTRRSAVTVQAAAALSRLCTGEQQRIHATPVLEVRIGG